MQITNRLWRAGVTTRVRVRAAARPTILTLAALAVSACQDGFFFDPAQTRDTSIAVTYTLVEGAPASAPSVEGMEGATGPQTSPGAAFDKADGAQVVLRHGENELFNQRLPLEAVGSDKKLSFTVELPAGSVVQASLSLTLLRGQDQIFSGAAQAQLTPGQPAEVTVPLQAVVARVAIQGGPFVIRTLGGTVRLTAAGLFATGDVVGTVAPTYQALTPNLTVAADGTVTAAINGEGRVAATYLGRADTVTVMVEDRCFGPFTNIAVGQTVTGTLEPNDCLDAPNNSYNDWYSITLATPTLFRATLQSDGFETLVGAHLPSSPRARLGAAAATGPEVVAEYYLPAGSYLLRAGSWYRAAPPAPTGSYTLALTPESEPQRGCWEGRNSILRTFMVPGTQLAGRLSQDDCSMFEGPTDNYGVLIQAGDTAVVTVEGAFDYQFKADHDVRRSPPGGGRTQWAFAGDVTPAPWLFIGPGAARSLGAYTIRVDGAIPAGYDACANPPVDMGSIFGGVTVKNGRLQRRIDCESFDRVSDAYAIDTPPEAFQATLSSQDFEPFVAAVPPDRGSAGFGRSSASGSVTAEFLFPQGHRYELRALPRGFISSGAGVEGTYELSTQPVPIPQQGCMPNTFVFFGSVASGQITGDDCEDEFDNEPDVARRRDGYTILLLAGETVTVTATGDFPLRFTRWTGGAYVEGHFGVAPGGQVSFTVTQPEGAGSAFHQFNVISDTHHGTGNYTVSFAGTPKPSPGGVNASGRVESPILMLPDWR